jgi:hypothetical protein
MTLTPEIKRLNGDLTRVLYKDSSAAEVPLRMHDHGTDSGHGLGGPPFHPKLVSYLKSAGVCFCEPQEVAGRMTLRHYCDRRYRESRFDARAKLRPSERHGHPHRLKRALRQLQNLVPYDQYHIVYLMVSRGRDWQQTLTQVNDNRARRGDDPLAVLDFEVMMVAGFDLLMAAW